MSEICPTCGQSLPRPAPIRRLISTAHEVLALLRERGGREVYKSQAGTWHYTYAGDDRHVIDAVLVGKMVASGALRPTYLNQDCSFGIEPTIDLDATMAERRKTGNKLTIVYAPTPEDQPAVSPPD